MIGHRQYSNRLGSRFLFETIDDPLVYINFDWHIYYRIILCSHLVALWFWNGKTKALIFIIPLRMVISFVYRLRVCHNSNLKWQVKCPLVNSPGIYLLFFCSFVDNGVYLCQQRNLGWAHSYQKVKEKKNKNWDVFRFIPASSTAFFLYFYCA